MKTHTLTSSCLLLLLAAPAWGQLPPQPAGRESRKPLNLSLPRDVLSKPTSVNRNESEDTASRNLQQEEKDKANRSERQPYGAGYEARMRGMTTESGGFGAGGVGSAGMGGGAGTGGGGGHGSMGRGR